MDFEAELQAREANPVSNTLREYHLHDFSKSTWSYKIVTHVTNILQNFWLTLTDLFLNSYFW